LLTEQLLCCDRGFPGILVKASSRPHLKHIGPDYVAAVIANFLAVARAKSPAGAEAERTRLAAAAVLPLTELLAAPGPIEDVPVADWMLRGGAHTQAQRVF